MIRSRSGFTLIEILIVVVVTGTLAAIAVPRFTAGREASFYTAMRSDLTNLGRVQEMYGSTGAAAWTASGGTPAVSVTDDNAGAPVCND